MIMSVTWFIWLTANEADPVHSLSHPDSTTPRLLGSEGPDSNSYSWDTRICMWLLVVRIAFRQTRIYRNLKQVNHNQATLEKAVSYASATNKKQITTEKPLKKAMSDDKFIIYSISGTKCIKGFWLSAVVTR